MRPVIAIVGFETDKYKAVPDVYVQAVKAAGGLPIIIENDDTLARDYVLTSDGILFAGGGDIAPRFYGEEADERVASVNEKRDTAELALFKEATSAGKQIFGICRGLQLINIALGGTLIQHIDGHTGDIRHTVNLSDCSILKGIFQKNAVTVNSSHHQAVKKLAPGLFATAWSSEGITEAFESVSGKIHAVQFHPERILDEDEGFIKIFEDFVSKTK